MPFRSKTLMINPRKELEGREKMSCVTVEILYSLAYRCLKRSRVSDKHDGAQMVVTISSWDVL